MGVSVGVGVTPSCAKADVNVPNIRLLIIKTFNATDSIRLVIIPLPSMTYANPPEFWLFNRWNKNIFPALFLCD